MTLWKQRLFTRLHKPAEDDGADAGSGALGAAIDALGDTPAASDAPADEPAAGPAADPAASASDEPANQDAPAAEPAAQPAKPGSRMAAMLDELSGTPSDKPADKPAAGAAPADEPAEPAADQDKPTEPPTADQEEAELLAGVKSERGKERIKQVFAERKQLEQDVTEFRELVKSTGMSAQDFAQTLEFGRLVNSGDEKNLRVALEMIEGQRAMLYQKLGVEAPGVDLLAGHDDLRDAVDNMEITRDKAVELAKYRKQQADVQQRQQAQVQQQQDRQAYEQTVTNAATAMEAYLQTRANEVDHQARMRVISEHFKNPENLQAFVTTYQPNQWAATIKMMYDSIKVPNAPAPAAPQPIRSRPASLGTPAPSAGAPIDRIAQRMESMGL